MIQYNTLTMLCLPTNWCRYQKPIIFSFLYSLSLLIQVLSIYFFTFIFNIFMISLHKYNPIKNAIFMRYFYSNLLNWRWWPRFELITFVKIVSAISSLRSRVIFLNYLFPIGDLLLIQNCILFEVTYPIIRINYLAQYVSLGSILYLISRS